MEGIVTDEAMGLQPSDYLAVEDSGGLMEELRAEEYPH